MSLWGGGYISCGCVTTPPPPPQVVSSPLLDAGGPVGLYDKKHACSDAGGNIIHLYVQLIQI